MRQIGLFTLATINERQSRCNDAIKHYRDAANSKGAFADEAYLGEARCSVQLGDISGAIAAYRQALKNQPESPSTNYLRNEIVELEMKQAAK
jgi:tetratricopeptide (TPR) repeat protein